MQVIYEYIKQNLDESGYLKDGYVSLPDMGDMTFNEGESWVPGAYEGTILRSEYSLKKPALVNLRIANVIKKYIKNPSESNFAKMTENLSKNAAISIVDPVVSFLANADKEKLRAAALDLIFRSTMREPLKVGISLLGQCGTEEDLPVLKALASHEEFTLYAAVAIRNIYSEYNSILLELLDRLKGWGKIATLYELDYDREESRFYVLTKGCRNEIGLSYLSNVCAIKGRLADNLEKAVESKAHVNEFYKGACDIFYGLLEMHPVNDTIAEYPDAERAAKTFYRLVNECDLTEHDSREEEILGKLKEFRYI